MATYSRGIWRFWQLSIDAIHVYCDNPELGEDHHDFAKKVCTLPVDETNYMEAMGNARLIASAPKLLFAVTWLLSLQKIRAERGERWLDTDVHETLLGLFRQATGENFDDAG